MSRIGGEHFSESITFEADGLEDILRLVREAKNETDLLHSSQLRAATQFGRGVGAMPGVSLASTLASRLTRTGTTPAGTGPSFAFQTAAAAAIASGGSPGGWNAARLSAASYVPPVPLARGMPTQAYGLQTSAASDLAMGRQRRQDAMAYAGFGGSAASARRMGTNFGSNVHEGPAPLPAQGIASWERAKRNAEQYRESIVKIVKEYDKLKTSASNWFHGDPMTRRLREQGRAAQEALRREQQLAEQARRRSMGFRGRLGEDWGREGGYRDRMHAAGGVAGNLALAGGLGVFGMGMAGLQGTVTGNRFHNEFERTQRELGNAFGPALREATHWLEQFNSWLSKLSPSGQRLIAAGGIAAAGYAGARALGLGGMIHGAVGGVAGAAMRGAAAYGPGALRALGGGSMLGGLGVAGAVGIGVATVASRSWDAAETMNLVARVREGKLDEKEASALPEELKLAHQRAGGRDRWEKEVEERHRNLMRDRFGMDATGKPLGIFATLNAASNMPAFGLSAILGGGQQGEAEFLRNNLPLLAAQKVLDRDGKLGVGGEKANKEPLAGGGFESLMQTYQRIETAFGKIDKGKDEQLKAAEIFQQAAQALIDAMNKQGVAPGVGGALEQAGKQAEMAAKNLLG